MTSVRIVHLSDPHFGTVLEPVRKALVERIQDLRPDYCLISGDITQRAQRSQFEDALRFKQSLAPVPTFAIPGNHDIPLLNAFGRLLSPYRGFQHFLQAKTETVRDVGPVRIFCLNSTSRWRHVQGSLDIQRVSSAMTEASEATLIRIAVIHHPLACAKRVDDKNLLVNREEVFRLFEAAGVDLVLSGHVHDPFVTLSNEAYTARRKIVLSVAGTCLSWRTRSGAPNSFQQIEIDASDPAAPRLTLSRYDWGADGHFSPREDWIFRFVRRGASGWEPA